MTSSSWLLCHFKGALKLGVTAKHLTVAVRRQKHIDLCEFQNSQGYSEALSQNK